MSDNPFKTSSFRASLSDLLANATLDIAGEQITVADLAGVHHEIPMANDEIVLSYEDVMEFCWQKGIVHECPSRDTFNSLFKSVDLRETRAVMDLAMERSLWREYREKSFDYDQAIYLASSLALTKSYKEFCRLLGVEKNVESRRLFRDRSKIYSEIAFRILNFINYYSVKLYGSTTINCSKRTIDNISRLITLDTKKASSERYRSLPYILNHIGDGKQQLVSAFFKALGSRVVSRYVHSDSTHPILNPPILAYAMDHIPWVRRVVVRGMKRITRKHSDYSPWKILATRINRDELKFLMEHFRKLPRAKQVRAAEEFLQVWTRLSNSKFTSAVHEMRDEIYYFNSWLILNLPEDLVDEAAKSLPTQSPGVMEWAELVLDDQTIPIQSKLGALGQYLSSPELRNYQLSPTALDMIQRIFEDPDTYTMNTRGVTYTPTAFPSEILMKGLKEIQKAAPTMATEEREYIVGLIKTTIDDTLAGRPNVAWVNYNLVEKYATLLETARMLGADIHEYGETYEQIEPRLFGYMHHRLPSGGIGNSYLSETGFLGTDKDGNKDSLRGTIEQDADYLRDRGLTSHALGAPLHAIRDYFFERSFAARPLSFDITINGTPYHVRYLSGPSGQSCPFIDSTDNRQPDLLIENMETHETLFFAGILAHIISEHTFFEGEHAGQYGGEPSVSYRIPPEKLIAFFNIPTQDKSEF